jgi:uncharacterized protein with PIN domain
MGEPGRPDLRQAPPGLARRLLADLVDAEVARVLALTDDEVRAELVAAGEDPGEAAREARARFGRIRESLGLRADPDHREPGEEP